MSPEKEQKESPRGKKRIVLMRSDAGADDVLSACGETLEEALSSALSGREHVVMVRVNTEILSTLDMLVESGICDSRSSAAAFVLREGIQANAAFFASVAETTKKMQRLKEDLKQRARPASGGGPSTPEGK